MSLADLPGRLRPEPAGPPAARSNPRGDHQLDGLALDPSRRPKPAAVLVPIVRRESPTVLLTRRASGLNRHSGQIAFPGGRVDEADAGPLAAALRETEEEIGLDRSFVRPVGYLDPYLSGSGYLIQPVVGVVEPGFALALNPVEVAGAFEAPLAFLLDEGNHELHACEWSGRLRQYYAIPFGDHYIWGVTAGILRNLFERLAPGRRSP